MTNDKITVALLIEVEGLIGTDRLNMLLENGTITMTFAEKCKLLKILCPDVDVEVMTIAETEKELSFFVMQLAVNTEAGRANVLGGLLLALMSNERMQLLQMYAQTSSRIDNLCDSLLTALQGTKATFETF